MYFSYAVSNERAKLNRDLITTDASERAKEECIQQFFELATEQAQTGGWMDGMGEMGMAINKRKTRTASLGKGGKAKTRKARSRSVR